MPSLKKSLAPSASVIRIPKGPARFGPTRTCMSATTLRSSQITSITATSRAAKMTTTLITSRIQVNQSILARSVMTPPRRGLRPAPPKPE